jgi:hypothetical protein
MWNSEAPSILTSDCLWSDFFYPEKSTPDTTRKEAVIYFNNISKV